MFPPPMGNVLMLDSRWVNHGYTDDTMRDTVYDEMLRNHPELHALSADENTQLGLITLYALTGDRMINKLIQHEHRTLVFTGITEVYASVAHQMDPDYSLMEMGAIYIPTLWYYLGQLLNRDTPVDIIEPLTIDVMDSEGLDQRWLEQYKPFAPDTALH